MAHIRKRFIEQNLEKQLNFSPIVGVFGHRQVGKTTLLCSKVSDYITLDIRQNQDRVNSDPLGYLNGVTQFPFGIDEAQLTPDLFPALKEYVRLHPKPGRFLLSGSVRFTSRKAIRESLTGRITHLELLPFCQAELDQRSVNRFVLCSMTENSHSLLRKAATSVGTTQTNHDIVQKYLKTGGLPGVCFIRSAELRHQRLESQFETILGRDLRLIMDTKLSFETLRGLLVNLALMQGSPVELLDLSRKCRISVPTLRKMLVCLESLFLIRRLNIEGTEKRPVFYFEDQAEATHLAAKPMDPLTDMTRFLFAQIRIPLQLEMSKRVEYFQYRTRSGAYVPICVRWGQTSLGLMPILEENPNRNAMGSASSFLKKYPGSRVLFIHYQPEAKRISEDMLVVPIRAFV